MKSNFQYITTIISIFTVFLLVFTSCSSNKPTISKNDYPFRMGNLIPWSIVSFDSKERTPKERIEMIQQLGFSQYAYGNRQKQQPTMKQELLLAKEKGIKISAVWLYINLDKDTIGQLKPHSESIFKILEELDLQTQIWIGFQPKYFENLPKEESLKQSVAMVKYLSKRAKILGCKIALYNHGGWFGKANNQLKIIRSLPNQNIGIVFNFHHAHKNLDTFKDDIKKMLPYLWCVNLNGMKKEGPKIITIGKGNLEKKMIQELLDFGYKGPFGILGHVKGGDAEVILIKNKKGLQVLFTQ